MPEPTTETGAQLTTQTIAYPLLSFIPAIVIISLITVIGIVTLVVLRPTATDNLIIIGAISAILTPIFTALIAKISVETKELAYQAKTQAEITHQAVNSRIDNFQNQIIEVAKKEMAEQLRVARAGGRAEGIAEVRRQQAEQKVLVAAEVAAGAVKEQTTAIATEVVTGIVKEQTTAIATEVAAVVKQQVAAAVAPAVPAPIPEKKDEGNEGSC